jgi:adenosylhomocysteine nucleosidase
VSNSESQNATSGRGKKVAVVAALEEELSPLGERMRNPVSHRMDSLETREGLLGDVGVVLAATGDGEQAARVGIARLLAHQEVDALIVVGVAGGLDPALQAGAIVAARAVHNGTEPVGEPDQKWLGRALEQAGTVEGTVVSSSGIAIDSASKSRLWLELDGRVPAVVDLESATYAREAVTRGIPYLVLRAVSDTADETLPLDFNRFRDAHGRIDRNRVLRHALLHPHLLPRLLALRERVQECARRLADVTEGLLCE